MLPADAPASEQRGGAAPGFWEHWQAWAPVLVRVAATGLALLGLAGIGLAARGSNELGALASAPLSASLARLAGARGEPASPRASAAPSSPDPMGAPAPVARAPIPCAPVPALPPEQPGAETAAAGYGLGVDGRVILNQAGLAELQRLPGIGAKRAAAILELRQRLGRFRRPSDLLRIKGIGPRTLERMLPRLVLDGSPSSAVTAHER